MGKLAFQLLVVEQGNQFTAFAVVQRDFGRSVFAGIGIDEVSEVLAEQGIVGSFFGRQFRFLAFAVYLVDGGTQGLPSLLA